MPHCSHKNPLHHAFCVICGEALARLRCPRCGAVCDRQYLFCGQCGENIKQQPVSATEPAAAVDQDHRYNLDALLAVSKIPSDASNSTATPANKRVAQDDIQAMIASMKKGK